MNLTYAFCTYKRAERLEALVQAIRALHCPIPFEILVINNNSPDNAAEILDRLAAQPGIPLRWVMETRQGIVPARNRAIEESLDSDIFMFIDDDELPHPGLLDATCHALLDEGADCVGGRIQVDFSPHGRPQWLGDDLLGFLAEVNYSNEPFWITQRNTPIWTSNIAYKMRLFRDDPALRFDDRFSREGDGLGGGEDTMMFRALLGKGLKLRYRPDMVVSHFVEPWRLNRSYFLKLHYIAGVKYGRFTAEDEPRTLFGIPPYRFILAARQTLKTLLMYLKNDPGSLRQAMNMTHAWGTIAGHRQRHLTAQHTGQ